ncbi:TlpA family protein disulfide reductase [Marilutibacter alkalisoli]|uniref:TlpA family protein disulfide reductase n=1 Tax=Marilutibacter alkalisoli TaxID=2591633 RepID=A0A514BTU4_9GAMM|nr:TlpA disulfide reductase family protein [Lysobacter alkalisoli]QDH70725.1 TlpA family protein disulfide reductase [Lysobacter alkalisoli]
MFDRPLRGPLGTALLTALLLCALAACKREQVAPADVDEPTAAATVDETAERTEPAGDPERPRLRVTTVEGQPYDLADHRGRWVVVNFWATWCKPCLKEMPELSALDAMREHIEVIGLAYEEIEVGEMRSFLEKHPVVYPIAIIDTYDPPADFETPRGLPMTYLIAPDGRVAERFLGPVTARDIEAAIARAGETAGVGPQG